MIANRERPLYVCLSERERIAFDRLVADIGAEARRPINASDMVRALVSAAIRAPHLRREVLEGLKQMVKGSGRRPRAQCRAARP